MFYEIFNEFFGFTNPSKLYGSHEEKLNQILDYMDRNGVDEVATFECGGFEFKGILTREKVIEHLKSYEGNEGMNEDND